MNGLKKLCVWGSLVAAVGLAFGCGASRPSKYYQLTPPSGSTSSEQSPSGDHLTELDLAFLPTARVCRHYA